MLQDRARPARRKKFVLDGGKFDTSALESNPFSLQQEALLKPVFAGQGDSSSRSKNTLPRQTRHLIQDFRDVARTSGIAGRFGDRTVGADFSARNFADGGSDGDSERQFAGRFPGHGSR